MKCISRITDDTYSQYFGNGRNKFYVEFRCGRPCINELDVCAKCFEKNTSCKLQNSRKFNHGKINEPIPDESHIYGGKWFYNSAKKWGTPPPEIVQFALQYQKEARGDYIVVQPTFESYKADATTIKQDMSNLTTKFATTIDEPKKKPGRKPKTVASMASITSETNLTEINKEKKSRRKPTVATVATDATDATDTTAPESINKQPKKQSRRKNLVETAYTSIIHSTKPLVHKEVVLPTHIESTLDMWDADGYSIEYVKLTLFEINGITYYKDSGKNKLYKKVKDKIGEYIGRWNPENETIYTDVPDSDAE